MERNLVGAYSGGRIPWPAHPLAGAYLVWRIPWPAHTLSGAYPGWRIPWRIPRLCQEKCSVPTRPTPYSFFNRSMKNGRKSSRRILWLAHTLDSAYHGRRIPWLAHTLVAAYLGRRIPWPAHTLTYAYPAQRIPWLEHIRMHTEIELSEGVLCFFCQRIPWRIPSLR